MAGVSRACRRRHYLRYVLGYRPVETAEELRFGTLLHAGLEAWWRAAQREAPLDDWLAEAQGAVAARPAEALDRAKLQVLLTGYHLRWGPECAERYEVLGVEQVFRGPLINPRTGKASKRWELAGKLDALVRDRRDRRILVVEHKSSSEDISPGSDYWRRLRLDGQVSTYFEGARLLGHQVDACLYDVVGKLQQRELAVPVVDELGNKVVLDARGERVRTAQGKWRQTGDAQLGYVLQTRPETEEELLQRLAGVVAEAPERYFARGEVVRLEADLVEGMTDTWQLAQSLRDELLEGRRPRTPEACIQPGRVCPYFSVCAGEASLEDPARFVRSDDIHPELAA